MVAVCGDVGDLVICIRSKRLEMEDILEYCGGEAVKADIGVGHGRSPAATSIRKHIDLLIVLTLFQFAHVIY